MTVPLTQNQFDSICSLVFNIGLGAFQTSTLLKVLNTGKYERVPDEMRKWVHSGGKVNQGLLNRRNSEIGQWTRGAFVSSATVSVDPPPSWWQQAHNQLKALGSSTIVGSLTSAQLQDAGTKLQTLPWHRIAMIGAVLFGIGIFWDWFRKRQA